jgi:hypothetical protein
MNTPLLWTSHASSVAVQEEGEATNEGVPSGHSNFVVDMELLRGTAGGPSTRVSTAGWDGRVLIWTRAAPGQEKEADMMKGLRIG